VIRSLRRRRACAGAVLASAAGLLAACATVGPGWPAPVADPLHEPFSYRAPRAVQVPTIGAGLEAGAWASAPWTEWFGDIEGDRRPAPRLRTRAKVMWDDRNLYIAAEMEEPHVWSSLRARDAIVFHDNDFEAFIDPDGDGREYYELEANAAGTLFDLYLHRSYRDGGPAIHEWDAQGIVTEVAVDGTPDDPRDQDRGWIVQWSVPWSAFRTPVDARIASLPEGQRGFGESSRAGRAPRTGESWRMNFSRVQWKHLVTPGSAPSAPPAYSKVPGVREDNWTWTPQWAIDMHLPRFWGTVTFVEPAAAPSPPAPSR
jgi:hypothetical protein